MGATLGNTVEGSWEMSIGSKQTRAASPFMTVFDEVGYYTAQGMAVMAAQARSLGFSLVFAAQDIPSMEKRVKQEAKSIMANCNLKIYGRIEDPLDTMDFIAKHTQNDYVMETTSMKAPTNTISSMFMAHPFYDEMGAKIDKRVKFDGDHLKFQREGEIHYTFAELFGYARMFYVDAGMTENCCACIVCWRCLARHRLRPRAKKACRNWPPGLKIPNGRPQAPVPPLPRLRKSPPLQKAWLPPKRLNSAPPKPALWR